MKSYKEYNKGKLSEAVTINDNIWAYLNKEIDSLFAKLKNAIRDTTTPRSDWTKNIHKRLFDLQHEGANRIHFSLSEYKSINNLLDEMSSVLREADGEDWQHLDNQIDLYKDKFKEIIKNLFARIRVNRKTAGSAAAAPPATAASPLSNKPIANSPAVGQAPEINKPLVEPETYNLAEPESPPVKPMSSPKMRPVKPKPTAQAPSVPAQAPSAPAQAPSAPAQAPSAPAQAPSEEPEEDLHASFDATHKHAKAQEDELVKLGYAANLILQGIGENEALDMAEKELHTIVGDDERKAYIRFGQKYLKQQGENGGEEPAAAAHGLEEPAAAAHGLEEPAAAAHGLTPEKLATYGLNSEDLEGFLALGIKPEDFTPPEDFTQEDVKERADLIDKYLHKPNGQRNVRRLVKKNAPELVGGEYIKKRKLIIVLNAYVKKMHDVPKRKRRGGGIKETVEYYRDLLRNPNRTVFLLDEAEKIESIKDRVEFYKSRLRLTGS